MKQETGISVILWQVQILFYLFTTDMVYQWIKQILNTTVEARFSEDMETKDPSSKYEAPC